MDLSLKAILDSGNQNYWLSRAVELIKEHQTRKNLDKLQLAITLISLVLANDISASASARERAL